MEQPVERFAGGGHRSAGGLAAYLFLNQGALRQQADENEKKAQAMEQQLAQAKGEVDKLAKEKEAELAKLKQAQNDMLQSLKKEVEAGEGHGQPARRPALGQNPRQNPVRLRRSDDLGQGPERAQTRRQGVGAGARQGQGHPHRGPYRQRAHRRRRSRTSSRPTGNSPPRAPPPSCAFLAESSKIPPDAFEAAGLGRISSRCQERHPQSRQQNRRIEIILYPRVQALAKELPKAKEPAAVDIKPSP